MNMSKLPRPPSKNLLNKLTFRTVSAHCSISSRPWRVSAKCTLWSITDETLECCLLTGELPKVLIELHPYEAWKEKIRFYQLLCFTKLQNIILHDDWITLRKSKWPETTLHFARVRWSLILKHPFSDNLVQRWIGQKLLFSSYYRTAYRAKQTIPDKCIAFWTKLVAIASWTFNVFTIVRNNVKIQFRLHISYLNAIQQSFAMTLSYAVFALRPSSSGFNANWRIYPQWRTTFVLLQYAPSAMTENYNASAFRGWCSVMTINNFTNTYCAIVCNDTKLPSPYDRNANATNYNGNILRTTALTRYLMLRTIPYHKVSFAVTVSYVSRFLQSPTPVPHCDELYSRLHQCAFIWQCPTMVHDDGKLRNTHYMRPYLRRH